MHTLTHMRIARPRARAPKTQNNKATTIIYMAAAVLSTYPSDIAIFIIKVYKACACVIFTSVMFTSRVLSLHLLYVCYVRICTCVMCLRSCACRCVLHVIMYALACVCACVRLRVIVRALACVYVSVRVCAYVCMRVVL